MTGLSFFTFLIEIFLVSSFTGASLVVLLGSSLTIFLDGAALAFFTGALVLGF